MVTSHNHAGSAPDWPVGAAMTASVRPIDGRRGSRDTAGDGGEPAEREPDPRFTLANERTFLAWSRTALALIAAGLGIIQLLPPFPGVPGGRHALGVPLIVLGAALAVAAYADMRRKQTALRRSEPLPRSIMPGLLAFSICAVAAGAAVIAMLSASG